MSDKKSDKLIAIERLLKNAASNDHDFSCFENVSDFASYLVAHIALNKDDVLEQIERNF